MDRTEEFRQIVNEMADLYARKNEDYGDSFAEVFKKLGPTSALVPLWNKTQRATTLIQKGEGNFESVEDTLKDLACYAIMGLIAMRHKDEN